MITSRVTGTSAAVVVSKSSIHISREPPGEGSMVGGGLAAKESSSFVQIQENTGWTWRPLDPQPPPISGHGKGVRRAGRVGEILESGRSP